MREPAVMDVRLITPTDEVFGGAARACVARGPHGRFAILPNHADAAAPLLAGVVSLTLADGSERHFGVDEGALVKQGRALTLCVFRAVPGESLAQLRDTVAARFGEIADRERRARTALARLEAGALRRFVQLREARQ